MASRKRKSQFYSMIEEVQVTRPAFESVTDHSSPQHFDKRFEHLWQSESAILESTDNDRDRVGINRNEFSSFIDCLVDSMAANGNNDGQRCEFDELESPLFSENELDESTLNDDLIYFFLTFSISRRGMQWLLDILRKHGCDVATSPFMLFKDLKKRKFNNLILQSDKLAYISVEDNIRYCIEKKLLDPNINETVGTSRSLRVIFNIDGVPLFNGSRLSLWPITMIIENIKQCFPLPVAIHCGFDKPDMNVFLEEFMKELRTLCSIGINISGIKYIISRILIVADAPARSMLQSVKSHSGFHGCYYCRQKGVKRMDRLLFPEYHSSLRTNQEYRNFRESNQLKLSPLFEVVNPIEGFPLDYMHLICLGVTKRLFKCLFDSIKGIRIHGKLSISQKNLLSTDIKVFNKSLPYEFKRKLRPLTELAKFKAIEYRIFILYAGPILFRKYMKDDFYRNFLYLHFATYILCSDSCSHLIEHAEYCIEQFLTGAVQLYGDWIMTYNFHNLLHLPQFYRLYGKLDNYSSFPFENYLGVLKRRIKASSRIFKQSINVLFNIREIFINRPIEESPKFTEHHPDNCAITVENKVILITEVLKSKQKISLNGYELRFSHSVYEFPYDSNSKGVGMGYYTQTKNFLKSVIPSKKAILYCMLSEDEHTGVNHYVVIPFCSSNVI